MNENRLAQPLDRARIKSRQGRGAGPALSYLETHDVIRTANDIFGFGGWGHEVVELRLLPGVAVKNKDGKDGIQVGYICIVRLTVTGGIPVSGIGYGDAVEYTQSAPVTAHELAAKEAESDALKRALKNYGDQFGLALYDKAAASSGHVTDGKPKPAPESRQNGKPADTAETETVLLALVLAKNGDVEAARADIEKNRGTPGFAQYLADSKAWWEAHQPGFQIPQSPADRKKAAAA